MGRNLTEAAAIEIANTYVDDHNLGTINTQKYEIVSVSYLRNGSFEVVEPIWAVTYDVYGWDDMWFSIIISDAERVVICYSNAWNPPRYNQHIVNKQIRIKKLTPKERRLLKEEQSKKNQ